MAYKPLVDDGRNIGNTPGSDGKGRLHVKVANVIADPVPVFVVDSPPSDDQTIALIYNGITNVATSVSALLLSYTVPAGKRFFAIRVEIGGTNIAKYSILINSSLCGVKRTWFGEGLNETFEFASSTDTGVGMQAGDTIAVNVIHQRPDLGDFDATLVGLVVG